MAAQIAEAQKLVTGEAEADPIARLYAAFEVCANCDPSNVDEASKAAYGTILASASHSADGVRQLVTGFIPRFFHLFPGQAQTALNAQLDLVEDDEASIRLAAIPGLVELCRRSSEPVQTVASVLGQLLLSEDQTELKTVQESLRKLFDLHQSSAFSALFQQIRVSEGAQRGKSIDCIARQLRLRADQVKADEALQQHVADETKAVLKHESVADVKEFRSLLRIVRRLPIFSKNPRIARSVVATIAEKAGLKSGAPVLDARDADVVARASQYVDMAVGLFKQRYRAQPPVEASAGVPAQAAVEPPNAGPMFAFFVSDVMPALEAADVPDKHKVVLFQNAATLLQFCPSDVAIAAFEPIAAKFLASLPSGDGAAATNFGIMEPLLAMIHTLSRGNLRGAKYQLGLFVKTGQPSDFRADLVDKKERVVNGLQALLQELETYVQRVRVVLTKFKTQQRELINAKKAASKTTAAAAAAAVAGVAEAVPDAPAKSGKEEADEDGDDEEEEATGAAAAAAKAAATADPLKVLREKMASLKVALRRADAIRAMCPPLMKDAPNFMDVNSVRLSWGKQQQQQQQKKKKQQQGQKKKGGSAQAAANAAAGAQKGGRKNQKKRGAQQQQQGGGQRKRRKGQQQGQQQQQQGKKKKNGGGQQQKQGGGRRRRGRN